MSDLRSRVAYLHGLAEGLELDSSSAEGRVLSAMLDVVGDMADEINMVTEAHDALSDYVDEMDDDLSAIEESVYTDDEDEIIFLPDSPLVEEEDGVEMVCCPECGETVSGGAGELADSELTVTCPVCGCAMAGVEE